MKYTIYLILFQIYLTQHTHTHIYVKDPSASNCWLLETQLFVLQSLMNRFLPPAKYWIFFFFIKTAVVFIQGRDCHTFVRLHPIASVLTRPQWNLRMCRYRSPDCVKRRSHHLHACGFSRVCTTACRLRLCEYWKLFPHCPQVYGFSPECVRSCRLSVYMQEKVLPHVEQVGTEPSGESLERTPSFSLKCELRWSWSTWALGKTLLQSGHMQTCCLPGGRRTPLDVEMSEDARSSSSSPSLSPRWCSERTRNPFSSSIRSSSGGSSEAVALFSGKRPANPVTTELLAIFPKRWLSGLTGSPSSCSDSKSCSSLTSGSVPCCWLSRASCPET